MPEDPKPFSRSAEDLIAALRRLPNEIPARMRKRPTQGLGPLIEELLVKNQIGRASPEQLIRDHWAEIVGPANAQYSHAANIDPRGRLIVLASHAVVRNELFHHRQMIVAKIQKLPGCAGVRDLTLRQG
jgi:hypothetical protein